MATPVLLIGKPHSGKTTFIGQLYSKIDSNKSAIKFYKPVENLMPIISALRNLSDGNDVAPTPTDKSTTMYLPLLVDGKSVDLECPDYGGEQINNIIESREIDSKWLESIRKSDNWILFIKPSDLSTSYDLSNKTIKPEVLESSSGDAGEHNISDQSSFIELLQILLHVKGHDSHLLNSITKLSVVLTCWDELQGGITPTEELRRSLPLLMNFIEANWSPDRFNLLGLSSLGFSLKENGNKIKYQELGSQNFGYVLKSNGTKVDDITQLISEIL